MQTIQQGFEEVVAASFGPLVTQIPPEQMDQLRAFFFAGVRWLTSEMTEGVHPKNSDAFMRSVEDQLDTYISEFEVRHGLGRH